MAQTRMHQHSALRLNRLPRTMPTSTASTATAVPTTRTAQTPPASTTTTTTTTTCKHRNNEEGSEAPSSSFDSSKIFAVLDVAALDDFFLQRVFYTKVRALIQELQSDIHDNNHLYSVNSNQQQSSSNDNSWLFRVLSQQVFPVGLLLPLLRWAYLWSCYTVPSQSSSITPAARVLGLNLALRTTTTTITGARTYQRQQQFWRRYVCSTIMTCVSPLLYDQLTNWIHRNKQHAAAQEHQQALEQPTSPQPPRREEIPKQLQTFPPPPPPQQFNTDVPTNTSAGAGEPQQQQEQQQQSQELGNRNSTTRVLLSKVQRQQQQQEQQQQTQLPPTKARTAAVLALQRQLQVAQGIKQSLDLILPMAQFGLLVHCWWNQNNNSSSSCTTDFAQWLAGLSYQLLPTSIPLSSSSSSQQQQRLLLLQVSFAHRRYLWEELERCGKLWIWDGLQHWYDQLWQPIMRYNNRIMTIVQRWYHSNNNRKINHGVKKKKQNGVVLSHNDNTNNNNTGILQQPQESEKICPFCQTKEADIIAPMKTIECNCAQVYCYACLYHELRRRPSASNHAACFNCGQGNLCIVNGILQGAHRATSFVHRRM